MEWNSNDIPDGSKRSNELFVMHLHTAVMRFIDSCFCYNVSQALCPNPSYCGSHFVTIYSSPKFLVLDKTDVGIFLDFPLVTHILTNLQLGSFMNHVIRFFNSYVAPVWYFNPSSHFTYHQKWRIVLKMNFHFMKAVRFRVFIWSISDSAVATSWWF